MAATEGDDWRPDLLAQMLEEESASERVTIERINMLKAQQFQLERSNALTAEALNSQHDILTALGSALGAMRDLVLAADAAKREDGPDVVLPADTWRQLVLHARRAQERSRRSVAQPRAQGPRVAGHQLLKPAAERPGRGMVGQRPAPGFAARGTAAASPRPGRAGQRALSSAGAGATGSAGRAGAGGRAGTARLPPSG